MFLWWGPELVQLYNDAYVPSFGKGKHPAAMGQRGRDCWQEIWPIIWPQIDDVMSHGKPSWNEDQLVPIFRNGRLEDVYWTYGYSPVYGEAGEVAGTLVVCIEATVRILAERRLRTLGALASATSIATNGDAAMNAAGEVFRGATEDIPFVLVYAVDPRSGEARLSMSVGFAGEVVGDLVPSFADAPRMIALREGAPSGGSSEAFVMPLAAGGGADAGDFIVFGISPRLPFDDAYRDYLGQLAEHLVLARTRLDAVRSRVATELARNNLLLQAPVATALLIGPEHVFQLANPLFCKLVGRHGLVGKTYIQALPELAGTDIIPILDRVYQTGVPFVTNEYLVPMNRHGDGTLDNGFYKFNVEPLRDATGAVYGMMAVAVEITEQVNARRVLEKAQVERDKLLAELEAASRAKDEFLAMLGHELRNPLSPIVTALKLMKLRDGGRSTREQDIIERQVGHMVRLVDDLLDVSKITGGKLELRKEPVEIAEVIAKAVEIASYLLEQRGHHLVINAPRLGLCLDADPVRLAQVVANLLTNAARYTPVGGHIRVTAFRDEGEIVISVADDGTGISAEMLPQIFDRFVQGKRSADRAEGGLGLGLTLVRNLVALHRGAVVAKSGGANKGSEFVVRLPLTTSVPVPSPVPVSPLVEPALALGPSRRVLVVDDNADAAEMLGDVLRSVGHEVAIATNPLTALELAARFEPDIAVLDIGLPVMDGYELAIRMRRRQATKGFRLIAVTGYGQEHDFARSEEAGFDDHLVKPVDVSRLLCIVGRAP